eukprot:COSAG02_NODE_671_length_18661_cov_9.755953_8_plen_1775_part_00
MAEAGVDMDCCICMQVLVQPVVTPCGHAFDKRCLASVPVQQDEIGGQAPYRPCPSCRAPIPTFPPLRVCTVLRDVVAAARPEDVAARERLVRSRELLGKAAAEGNTTEVEDLLETCPNLRTGEMDEDEEGTARATPLVQAIRGGHAATVNVLLRYGASVADSSRPLYFAVKAGRLDIVKSLLAAGARVDPPPRDDDAYSEDEDDEARVDENTSELVSPLCMACSSEPGSDSLALATALLDAGADCDGTCRHGISALFHALESKQEAVALLLIARGVTMGLGTDPDYVESKPIDRAAQHGLTTVVETLLRQQRRSSAVFEHPEDAGDDETHEHATARLLRAAVTGGHSRTLRLLLQQPDLDVDSTDDHEGYTALHWAAREGTAEIVELLLIKADARRVTNGQPGECGRTAVRFASNRLVSADEAADVHEAERILLLLSAKTSLVQAMGTFQGSDIAITPLHDASVAGSVAVVDKFLAQAQSSRDQRTGGPGLESVSSALMLVCRSIEDGQPRKPYGDLPGVIMSLVRSKVARGDSSIAEGRINRGFPHPGFSCGEALGWILQSWDSDATWLNDVDVAALVSSMIDAALKPADSWHRRFDKPWKWKDKFRGYYTLLSRVCLLGEITLCRQILKKLDAAIPSQVFLMIKSEEENDEEVRQWETMTKPTEKRERDREPAGGIVAGSNKKCAKTTESPALSSVGRPLAQQQYSSAQAEEKIAEVVAPRTKELQVAADLGGNSTWFVKHVDEAHKVQTMKIIAPGEDGINAFFFDLLGYSVQALQAVISDMEGKVVINQDEAFKHVIHVCKDLIARKTRIDKVLDKRCRETGGHPQYQAEYQILWKGQGPEQYSWHSVTTLVGTLRQDRKHVIERLSAYNQRMAKQATFQGQSRRSTTLLIQAVRSGNSALVDFLLEKGAPPDQQTTTRRGLGHGPLHSAASEGKPELVARLLDAGAPIDAAGTLHNYSEQDDYADLVEDGTIQSLGYGTALEIAVEHMQYAVVQLLLARGADVKNALSRGCCTVTHKGEKLRLNLAEIAAYHGDLGLVNQVLDASSSYRQRAETNKTAAVCLQSICRTHIQCSKRAEYAAIRQEEICGHQISYERRERAATRTAEQNFDAVIADVPRQIRFCAAMRGHTSILQYMIQQCGAASAFAGASYCTWDEFEVATRFGHTSTVEALLPLLPLNGLRVRDHLGSSYRDDLRRFPPRSPLTSDLASQASPRLDSEGCIVVPELYRLLEQVGLAKYIKKRAKDMWSKERQWAPVRVARVEGWENDSFLAFSRYFSGTQMTARCEKRRKAWDRYRTLFLRDESYKKDTQKMHDLSTRFSSHRFARSTYNFHGRTIDVTQPFDGDAFELQVLQVAFGCKTDDEAREALSAIRNTVTESFMNDLEQRVVKEWTTCTMLHSVPLIVAAMYGQTEICKVLLANGADPLGQDGVTGMTTIHAAARQGNVELLKLLLEDLESSDKKERLRFLNIADRTGFTALHYAVRPKDKFIPKLQGSSTDGADDRVWRRYSAMARDGCEPRKNVRKNVDTRTYRIAFGVFHSDEESAETACPQSFTFGGIGLAFWKDSVWKHTEEEERYAQKDIEDAWLGPLRSKMSQHAHDMSVECVEALVEAGADIHALTLPHTPIARPAPVHTVCVPGAGLTVLEVAARAMCLEMVKYLGHRWHSVRSIETLIYGGRKQEPRVSPRFRESCKAIKRWGSKDASRTDAIRILKAMAHVCTKHAQVWERLRPPWWEEERGELTEQRQAGVAMRTAARHRKQRKVTDFFGK